MKTKVPSFITILIMTLVTTVMWIVLSIIRAFSARPAPVVPAEVSEKLSPTLDRTAIEKIKGRIFLTEGEIPQTQIQSTPVTTPSPTPTEIPVEIATPTSVSGSAPTQEGGTPPAQ